ncbi:MAG: hypothetical protein HKN87_03205 [Saprospiraceae bacterium]|nr:hypothetical protein [Saprospiraceae bacterium]
MRIVAELPHEKYKITVFKSGHRFLLKFDAGEYDISIKFRDGEVKGVSDIKDLLTTDLLMEVEVHFIALAKTKFTHLTSARIRSDDWDEII